MVPTIYDAKITASNVPGIYQIESSGRYFFAQAHGDFVLVGDLLDTKNVVNLTDQAEAEALVKLVNSMPSSRWLVMVHQILKDI